jgi:hypothetical protein
MIGGKREKQRVLHEPDEYKWSSISTAKEIK